jgi:hemerythrin
MEFLSWSPDYDLPHPLINAQHQALLAALNAFAAATAADSEADPTETLVFLTKYTAEHFKDEERLMAQANYPHLAEHRAEHVALFEEVEDRVQAFIIDGDATGLLDFLRAWLLEHIGGADRQLAAYLFDHT